MSQLVEFNNWTILPKISEPVGFDIARRLLPHAVQATSRPICRINDLATLVTLTLPNNPLGEEHGKNDSKQTTGFHPD